MVSNVKNFSPDFVFTSERPSLFTGIVLIVLNGTFVGVDQITYKNNTERKQRNEG